MTTFTDADIFEAAAARLPAGLARRTRAARSLYISAIGRAVAQAPRTAPYQPPAAPADTLPRVWSATFDGEPYIVRVTPPRPNASGDWYKLSMITGAGDDATACAFVYSPSGRRWGVRPGGPAPDVLIQEAIRSGWTVFVGSEQGRDFTEAVETCTGRQVSKPKPPRTPPGTDRGPGQEDKRSRRTVGTFASRAAVEAAEEEGDVTSARCKGADPRKLRDMADKMEARIRELESGGAIGQQNVTARRARISSGLVEQGAAMRQLQTIMRAMADDIEAGTLPEALACVDSRAAIEELWRLGVYRESDRQPDRYSGKAREPRPVWPYNRASNLASTLQSIVNTSRNPSPYEVREGRVVPLTAAQQKQLEREAAKYRAMPEDRRILVAGPFLALLESLTLTDKMHDGGLTEDRRRAHRLQRMGLTPETADAAADAMFTYAVAALARGKHDPAAVDRKRAQEAAAAQREISLLIGKVPGFFPTPPSAAAELVRRAKAGRFTLGTTLEPSAGSGNLVAAALEDGGAVVYALEQNFTLAGLLQKRFADDLRVTIQQDDFTDGLPDNFPPLYDTVIMNPPFERGQDADHVALAWKYVKPGGVLACIVSAGLGFRQDRKAEGFRRWRDTFAVETYELAPGTFEKTDVRALVVIATKPAGDDREDFDLPDTAPTPLPAGALLQWPMVRGQLDRLPSHSRDAAWRAVVASIREQWKVKGDGPPPPDTRTDWAQGIDYRVMPSFVPPSLQEETEYSKLYAQRHKQKEAQQAAEREAVEQGRAARMAELAGRRENPLPVRNLEAWPATQRKYSGVGYTARTSKTAWQAELQDQTPLSPHSYHGEKLPLSLYDLTKAAWLAWSSPGGIPFAPKSRDGVYTSDELDAMVSMMYATGPLFDGLRRDLLVAASQVVDLEVQYYYDYDARNVPQQAAGFRSIGQDTDSHPMAMLEGRGDRAERNIDASLRDQVRSYLRYEREPITRARFLAVVQKVAGHVVERMQDSITRAAGLAAFGQSFTQARLRWNDYYLRGHLQPGDTPSKLAAYLSEVVERAVQSGFNKTDVLRATGIDRYNKYRGEPVREFIARAVAEEQRKYAERAARDDAATAVARKVVAQARTLLALDRALTKADVERTMPGARFVDVARGDSSVRLAFGDIDFYGDSGERRNGQVVGHSRDTAIRNALAKIVAAAGTA